MMRKAVNLSFLVLAIIAVITGMIMKYGKQTQLEVSHTSKLVIDSPLQSTPVSIYSQELLTPNN